MKEYEITYLVSDEVLEKDLNKVTGKMAGFIVENEGKVKNEEIWGRRKLAYPINKQTFATYVTLVFEMEPSKIKHFDHDVRVYKEVIRHLTILKTEKEEKLVVTKADVEAAGEEQLEEILGEKSFETVEGETEESRDLMSVRENAEDDQVEEAKAEVKEAEAEKIEEVKAEKEKPADKPKKVKKTKAPAKEEAPKKEEKPENEADRMKKLDEKLDELLSDDL